MAGSGDSGPFYKRSPEKLLEQVRKEEAKTTAAVFESDLSRMFGELLSIYNGRDTATVQLRLKELKTALEETVEGAFDHLFGGSVAKHTYVDGLSDIDSLILINQTALEAKDPEATLLAIEKIIDQKVAERKAVSRGQMAVTIEYDDGMAIQLLPAIRTKDGKVKVPSSRHGGWSEIDPIAFQEALTRRNNECGQKLVPTIKLAKAIIGQLPESQQLSGYHIESLAIQAFRNYNGKQTTTAMLPAFFGEAQRLVLSPIRDSTGQSIHVDSYLGPEGSDSRKAAGHLLGRLARRMRNATAAESIAQWRAIFDLES